MRFWANLAARTHFFLETARTHFIPHNSKPAFARLRVSIQYFPQMLIKIVTSESKEVTGKKHESTEVDTHTHKKKGEMNFPFLYQPKAC